MKKTWLKMLLPIALSLGIAAVCDRYFFTQPIISMVLQDFALLGILTMAESLVLVCGGIDLSLAGSALLCASLSYYLVETGGASAGAAGLVGIALSTAIGFLNGFCITRVGVMPVIVTLASATLARGISGIFTNNIVLFDTSREFSFLSGHIGVVLPVSVLITIGAAVVCTLIFRFTVAERQVFAVGGSERSASMSGLRVDRIKILSYGAAGLLSGIAGFAVLANGLLATRFYESGPELELLFAALLGGVTLRSRSNLFFQALAGAGLMAVINRIIYTFSIHNFFRACLVGVLALIIFSIHGGIFRKE